MTITALKGELKGLYKAEYKGYSAYGATEKEAVSDLKGLLKRRNIK